MSEDVEMHDSLTALRSSSSMIDQHSLSHCDNSDGELDLAADQHNLTLSYSVGRNPLSPSYGSNSAMEQDERRRKSISGVACSDQHPSSDTGFSSRLDNNYYLCSSVDVGERYFDYHSSFENRGYGAVDITHSDGCSSSSTNISFPGLCGNSLCSSDCTPSPFVHPQLETIKEAPPSSDTLSSRQSCYREYNKEEEVEGENSTVEGGVSSLKSSSATIKLSESENNMHEQGEYIAEQKFSDQMHKLSSPPSPPRTDKDANTDANTSANTSANTPTVTSTLLNSEHAVEVLPFIPLTSHYHENRDMYLGCTSSLSQSDPVNGYQRGLSDMNEMPNQNFIQRNQSIMSFSSKDLSSSFSLHSQLSSPSYPSHSELPNSSRPKERYPHSIQSMPSLQSRQTFSSISSRPSAQTFSQTPSFVSFSSEEESAHSFFNQPNSFSPPSSSSISSTSPYSVLPHSIPPLPSSVPNADSNPYSGYAIYQNENIPIANNNTADNRIAYTPDSMHQPPMYSVMTSTHSSSSLSTAVISSTPAVSASTLSYIPPYGYKQNPQKGGNGEFEGEYDLRESYRTTLHRYNQEYPARMGNHTPMSYGGVYPPYPPYIAPMQSGLSGLQEQSFSSQYHNSMFVPFSREGPRSQPPHLNNGSGNNHGSNHGVPQGVHNRERGRENGSSQQMDSMNMIDIQKVRNGEDNRTTLMIRNIPNSFTRATLVKIIDKKCVNLYNFLYLPMDAKTNSNMGFGYINMIDVNSVIVFYESFNGNKWPQTRSNKTCHVCYGRLQFSTEDPFQYCSDWSVMTGKDEFQPLFFKPKETNGKIEMVRVKPDIDFSMRKGDN